MMNKILAAGIFFLAGAGTAAASSFEAPQPRLFYSEDAQYRFEVIPPKGLSMHDAVNLQSGDYLALHARNAQKSPLEFVPVGILSVQVQGKYRVVWQRVLENRIAPGRTIITETSEGVRVVTINDFFMFRESSCAVVIYSETGRTLRRYSLEEIAPGDFLDRLYADRESVNALGSVVIENEVMKVDLVTSRPIEFSLVSGNLKPLRIGQSGKSGCDPE